MGFTQPYHQPDEFGQANGQYKNIEDFGKLRSYLNNVSDYSKPSSTYNPTESELYEGQGSTEN